MIALLTDTKHAKLTDDAIKASPESCRKELASFWTPEFIAELKAQEEHMKSHPDDLHAWEDVSREALAKLGDDE